MAPRSALPVLLLALIFLPWPTQAQVVLPGTQPGDLNNWELLNPGDCEGCHGQYVSQTYEPWDTWAGNMMANAARDPLFWAAVDIANQDVPGVGEFCLRCHAPSAWLAGRSTPGDGTALEGFPKDKDKDFQGVSCHFCHRMYEGPSGTPFLENGQYWVDDGTSGNEPPRRGPYAQTNAPHPFQQDSFYSSSEYCAVCHDLRNPLVELLDENGQPTGRDFPEQLTYTEWSQSAFAAEGTECQACHMTPVTGFACSDLSPQRPDVFQHDLAGANTFMMSVLRGEYGADLGRTAEFDYSIAKALDMLQNQSAIVEVLAPADAVRGQDLQLTVKVTNLSGHKLPTGYPEGRRMWLFLEAEDGLGSTFFESGVYETSTATLLVDGQLRIYEAIHGIHGQLPSPESFHLALNNRLLKDTRIPPRGMVPDADTQPIGATYPVQPGGALAHWDDAPYTIPVPQELQGPITVRATLRYQTASREYVEFLRDENTSGPDPKDPDFPNAPSRGQKMYDLWSQYGKSAPVDMRAASATLNVVDPSSAPIASSGRGLRMVAEPNPSAGKVFLRIEGSERSTGGEEITVYDVAGRIVRELGVSAAAAVSWDGRDAGGRRVASGLYFAVLRGPDGGELDRTKLVRLR